MIFPQCISHQRMNDVRTDYEPYDAWDRMTELLLICGEALESKRP